MTQPRSIQGGCMGLASIGPSRLGWGLIGGLRRYQVWLGIEADVHPIVSYYTVSLPQDHA